ncbi:MAG: class I SAM-dependent methyltransferase [Vicinamibacterales bacterium]
MAGRPALRILGVALSGLILSVASATGQQAEADRERTVRMADILTALGARDGAHIADVGAADGFYALRIARAVAPTGRAYAVDIDEGSLTKLRERAARDSITNVEVILGAPDDPKLPLAAIDAVLIRNAYHEMPAHHSVVTGVARGLRPGGTLVVIESIRDDNRAKTREEQVKEHEIAPEIVEAELREAGFEIVERQDPFTTFTRGAFWMIRARRPAAPR